MMAGIWWIPYQVPNDHVALEEEKEIEQNFAKTLSALAPVSLDSLVINMMMANTARIQIQP